MQLITIKKVIVASALMLSQFLTINTVHAGAVHFIDNDTYTTDTLSGLDWLDMTSSVNQSYNYVSGQFRVGGVYEGWRYASGNEINKLVSNYTGITYMENNYTQYQLPPGSIDNLFDLLGPTYREYFSLESGLNAQSIYGITADKSTQHQSQHLISWIFHDDLYRDHFDIVTVNAGHMPDDSDTVGIEPELVVASFLVRNTSPVPVPAAIWFMGTGLLGLLGFSRKRMVV